MRSPFTVWRSSGDEYWNLWGNGRKYSDRHRDFRSRSRVWTGRTAPWRKGGACFFKKKAFWIIQYQTDEPGAAGFGRYLRLHLAHAARAGDGSPPGGPDWGCHPVAGDDALPLPGAEPRGLCQPGIPAILCGELHRCFSDWWSKENGDCSDGSLFPKWLLSWIMDYAKSSLFSQAAFLHSRKEWNSMSRFMFSLLRSAHSKIF